MTWQEALSSLVRKRFPILYRPLQVVYSRLFDIDSMRLRQHIRKETRSLEQRYGQLTFIQVGSSDGFLNDPFHRWILHSDCSAHFFEPVPYCFRQLVENYRNSVTESRFRSLKFFNQAITATNNKLVFYSISESAVRTLGQRAPTWWNQLGSFDRDHIIKHLDGDLEPFIEEILVTAFRLDYFLLREQISRVHVIHIDTEGHDLKVLESLDLSQNRPELVVIEHKHLIPAELIQLVDLLEQNGYQIKRFKSDFLAKREQ